MGHFAIELKESVRELKLEMRDSRFFLEDKSKQCQRRLLSGLITFVIICTALEEI